MPRILSTKLSFCVAVTLIVCIGRLAAAQNGTASQSSGILRIKTGVKLMLELDTPLNSATARIDDVVWFTARNDVRVDGQVAMLRGTPIRGTVIAVKPAVVNGKNQRTEIQVRLEQIPLADGGSLAIAAENLKVQGEKFGGASSAAQGALGNATQGAMLGASIGRSAKAAGIGAVAAVGVGILSTVLQGSGPSSDVDLPAGSVFEAKLERPIDIPDPTMLAKSVPKPSVPTIIDTSVPATATVAVGVSPIPSSSPSSSPDPTMANDAPAPTVPAFEPLSTGEGTAAAPEHAATDKPTIQPSAEKPVAMTTTTLKVDVSLVQVDAIVRDRTGKPMANLRQEDFRILEDGVERPIQFFSRDKLPLAVALVVDRSGSVAPLMSQVQSAAYQALQLLKPGDKVCLFAFAGSVELLEELTTNRQRVANRIGSIHAGGGTVIVDGVTDALRYLAATAPDSRRAVIIISDNLEGNSATPLDRAIELALETEAVIYSVKVGNGRNPSIFGIPGIPGLPAPRLPLPGMGGNHDPVPALTKETGGEIFDASGGGSIPAALTAAVDRLKLRYTLGYPADSSAAARSAKGGYHRIQVLLASRFGKPDIDYTVHSRSGYYDPAPKPGGDAARR